MFSNGKEVNWRNFQRRGLMIFLIIECFFMDFFRGGGRGWGRMGKGSKGICRLIGWWGSGNTDDDKSVVMFWVRIKVYKMIRPELSYL